MMRRILVCATVAVIVGLSGPLAAASYAETLPSPAPLFGRRLPDVSALEEGRTIERQLQRGDDHRYRLALKSGERMRVIVEQRGVDVVAEIRDAAGKPIAEFNDDVLYSGEEQVDVVANVSGAYTVRITASPAALASGSYTIRIASRRAATESDRVLQQSRRLRTFAAASSAEGRFDEARALLERALVLTEHARGAVHTDVAMVAFQLANNALQMRDDARAQSLDQRAIAIFDDAYGADHPHAAKARALLAAVYEHLGQVPKADALLRRSLATFENTLGTDHRWYAQALVTQASVRADAGDFEAAESLDRRALDILERVGDADGIPYVAALNNLGDVYRQEGAFARAEELLRRALAGADRIEGPESYRASVSLQSLGVIARARGDYAGALEYDTRALAIRERILGRDHADIAPLLNNLGVLYRTVGAHARALSGFSRALEIREKTVGPYHRGTLNAVGNIARTYALMGDTANAIAYERRADAILEKQLALNLAVGSERQKLAFVRSVAERTDRTLSLHLLQAPGDPAAASLAALVLLQRKGRVQDAMADVFAAVRRRFVAGDRALLDRLNETNARLARVALSGTSESTRSGEQTLNELETLKEKLEATLSEHSAEFRAQTQPVTVEAIQRAVPRDAALVEFAVFRPFNPKVEQNADAYGPPRYAAYVVRQQAQPLGVDLGDVTLVDRCIDALRNALRDPGADVKGPARAVDERVMRPLRAAFGDATRLIISADGDLNLVPFEALIDEQGRYLIERYAMSYVTSGRDLLRMQIPRATPTGPVIVADPLFGEPTPATPIAWLAAVQIPSGAARTNANGSLDTPAMYFAPLSATGPEARAIKRLFPDAALLTGPYATKTALQQVRAPRILHIASHGFFLDDRAPEAAAPGADGNPLLRSGLAFAGANLIHDGHSDGILTALEASGLDLWGTKLVTLSACDTGVGEIRNGEGVYGLRRAFVLAGAEALVMSLWPVSDYIARETMVAYYTGLRDGLGRGDALREAKLTMLRRPNRRHPYYWAGFIQSGEWGDLNGKR